MEDRALPAKHLDHRRYDRLGKPRQLDVLAEDSAQHEHREIIFDEADHLFHEDAGKHRRHQRGVGQQHRAHGGNRREQDDAVAAVGHKHQKNQSGQHDQEIHGELPSVPDEPDLLRRSM
jgi:hypothetical protein